VAPCITLPAFVTSFEPNWPPA